MRAYSTTILLTATILIGELHTFWEGNTTVQNWIVNAYRPMTIQWNVKFLSQEVCIFAYFLAWILYHPNRVNRTTVLAFAWLSVFNIFLYLYNYKLGGFGAIYFWYAAFWILSYKGNDWLNWIFKNLHPPDK